MDTLKLSNYFALVEATIHNGQISLMEASQNRHLEVVKLLFRSRSIQAVFVVL